MSTPEPASPDLDTMATRLAATCNGLRDLLLEKNASYGNSAASPVRLWSSERDEIEQLFIRLDDKCSRMARGTASGEDTEADLLGYLLLIRTIRPGAITEAIRRLVQRLEQPAK